MIQETVSAFSRCVKGTQKICVRCRGRKKVFKINSVYSIENTGGKEIDCPMCLGTGYNKPIEEEIEEIKAINIKNKKDFKDGKTKKDEPKE
jgi:hypothetical protein